MPLLFALLIAFALVQLYFHHRFLRSLEAKHPAEWERLGRPALFQPKADRDLGFVAYLFKARFEALQDAEITAEGNRLRVISFGYLFICLTFSVVLFLKVIF